MIERITGLVIAEQPCGESDKRLTVLTPKGKIDVYANHARSYKNKFLNTARLFAYNEFQLSRRNGFYVLRDITPLEGFFGLNEDLERQALAIFFSDFASRVTIYDQPDNDMLRLMLNMLYALADTERSVKQIKAVFELKAMSIEGFSPLVGGCSVCGSDCPDGAYLDVMNGNIKCPGCYGDSILEGGDQSYESIGTARIIRQLDPAVLAAMRFIICADMKKLLSFLLEDDMMEELDSVCECYMLNHMDQKFETFEFYKSLTKKGQYAGRSEITENT